jgi:hypothetical protein
MTDRVSARRIDASKVYSSLLTAILVVVPFAIGTNTPPDVQKLVFLLMAFMGIALNILWIINVNSYRQLNSLKFQVIHEMERELPFACYSREWQILQDKKGNRNYVRLSRVERYVPLLLLVPYLVLLVMTLTR